MTLQATAQKFNGRFTCNPPQIIQTQRAPDEIRRENAVLCAEFASAMFGTLVFEAVAADAEQLVRVHLGEKITEKRSLDRSPPGTVRYRQISVKLQEGKHTYRVQIPAGERNTGRAAILMPGSVGEVLPFRMAEIEDPHGLVNEQSVRQIAAHTQFDDEASEFECSNETLNQVWQLGKHTIKATTFCGLYVDGDRERIPYEGDAYINQLSHYACDCRYDIARYTHEYLMQYPTWFADWNMHSVFMAWADYWYTGDTTSLKIFYEDLKAKTLIDLARNDGLIQTNRPGRTSQLEHRLHLFHERYISDQALMDLVDWPPGSFAEDGKGERDGHEMMPVNTVINALHYRAVTLMGYIAQVLEKKADATRFEEQARRVNAAVNEKLFDQTAGCYIDGIGSSHSSLHSNMFPLAFGMVPVSRQHLVVKKVKSRGMACSVYGAQYLLEALFGAGEAEYAIGLMAAQGDRSWYGMLEQGATMTMEAWGHKYKQNLDWNHAWGTAPVNIIVRKMFGIEPAQAGYKAAKITPQMGDLTHAHLKLPTILGTITADYRTKDGMPFYELHTPKEMKVTIDKSWLPGTCRCVVNGKDV